MLGSPINKYSQQTLEDSIKKIEKITDSDVLVFSAGFTSGVETVVKDLIEKCINPEQTHQNLTCILTTNGGTLSPVMRIVKIFRHFYKNVDFVVPDHAYSAGTIMCCSGDRIFMDYNSVLGPVDPQVPSNDGRFVSALGYLDKLNELLEKAKTNTITKPEFLILKEFDLGIWRDFEQAKDLTVDLLSEWLPKYKFKDWTIHSSTKKSVTDKEKKDRAKKIAEALGNNSKWKSHGRPIDRDELNELGLKIDRLEDNKDFYLAVMEHNNFMIDFMQKNNYDSFIQTRGDFCVARK